MNELAFRNWMTTNGKNKKVISDTVSRLKKIERELGNIDLDTECKNYHCGHLLELFSKGGRNETMQKTDPDLPLGNYQLNTYKYAIRLYFAYFDSTY